MDGSKEVVQVELPAQLREPVWNAIVVRLGYIETGTLLRRNDAIDQRQFTVIRKLTLEQERLAVDLAGLLPQLSGDPAKPLALTRALAEHVAIAIELRMTYIETGSFVRASEVGTREAGIARAGKTIQASALSTSQVALLADLELARQQLLRAASGPVPAAPGLAGPAGGAAPTAELRSRGGFSRKA